MITDLQGVGYHLCDPEIATRRKKRQVKDACRTFFLCGYFINNSI